MTEDQLKQLIKTKESQTLEFKESTGSKKEICETICAFANSDSGIILVGIKNDGSLSKTTITEKSQTDITDLFISFKPKIASLISFEVVLLDGFDILVITVQKSKTNNNFYKNTCYKRVGASNKDITEEIIQQITNQNPDWSAQICYKATIEDLDIEAIGELKLDLEREKPTDWKNKYQNKSDIELLSRLGLMIENQITNGCVLMFGKNEIFENDPRFLCFARIQWQYYPDKDVTKYGKSREQFFVPFYPAIKQIWNKINSKNDTLANQNLYQSEEKQFEEITIRELLLNSIIHRDYSSFGFRPFIEIIQDRDGITFKNSGKPPFDSFYDLEVNRKKDYRNPVLANFLNKTGLVDQEGFGLLDKVLDIQRKKGLALPILQTPNNETWITLKTLAINIIFAKKLFQRSDKITRKEIILLDKIISGQNSVPQDISQIDSKNLKERGLVEIRGIKNIKVYISKNISELVNQTEEFIIGQGYTREQMFVFIDNHIKEFGYVRLSNLRKMFPAITENSRKNLLSRSEKYKLTKKGSPSNWYYTVE